MPNDERGHNFRNQQEALRNQDRGGSGNDSMSARSLTIALFVAVAVLVVLIVLLIR